VAAVEQHAEYLSDIELRLRVLRLPAHSQEKKDALKKAQTYPELMVLPEYTLRRSLDAIIQVLDRDDTTLEEEDAEDMELVEAAKKSKRKNSLTSKIARYRELIKLAESIFQRYPASLTGRALDFSDFCYECGKSGGIRLTACAGCEIVRYCGRNCKLENWKKGHKEECNKVEVVKQRMLA